MKKTIITSAILLTLNANPSFGAEVEQPEQTTRSVLTTVVNSVIPSWMRTDEVIDRKREFSALGLMIGSSLMAIEGTSKTVGHVVSGVSFAYNSSLNYLYPSR